jgi:phosphatidylglycerol:prolipoprotein diacylglycerol transferase
MRPILISFHGWGVASAPVFAGLAALASYAYFEARKASLRLCEEDFWGLIAALAFGVFAGAVGFYALAYGGGMARNLHFLIRTRNVAGGSFLGTYLGAALAAYAFCRRRGLPFGPAADALGAAAPLGLAVMRVGCLLNGCCWGKPTTLPWGIVFRGPSALPPSLRGVPLHPTQLYELLGCLLIFWLTDRAARPRVASGRLRPGDGLAVSVALYAGLRFCVDFVRAGDPGVVAPLGLTVAQWMAAAAAAAAAARLLRSAAAAAPARSPA